MTQDGEKYDTLGRSLFMATGNVRDPEQSCSGQHLCPPSEFVELCPPDAIPDSSAPLPTHINLSHICTPGTG